MKVVQNYFTHTTILYALDIRPNKFLTGCNCSWQRQLHCGKLYSIFSRWNVLQQSFNVDWFFPSPFYCAVCTNINHYKSFYVFYNIHIRTRGYNSSLCSTLTIYYMLTISDVASVSGKIVLTSFRLKNKTTIAILSITCVRPLQNIHACQV